MQIVQPKYEILEIPKPTDHDEVLQFIEKIGRTCYKSEDKITTGSAEKFIKMLKDHHHWAMLEHYIFIIRVPVPVIKTIVSSIEFIMQQNPDKPVKYDIYEKMNYFRYSIHRSEQDPASGLVQEFGIVSTSATAINYLMQACKENDYDVPVFYAIGYFIKQLYPELIEIPEESELDAKNWYEGFNRYLRFKFMSNQDLVTLQAEGDNKSLSLHGWQTVLFTCSRGFSHECVRHRPASYAQSSTRYCNYSLGKFGSEIQVIDPLYFEHGGDQYNTWYNSCLQTERSYMTLIDSGATPQEARSVLPNSLMTELNMTARLGEWHHFFDMRADKPAHPEMKQLSVPLLNEFISIWPEIFNDLEYRLEENNEYLNIDGGSDTNDQ